MKREELLSLAENYPDNFVRMIKRKDINLYNNISLLKGLNFSEKLYRYVYGENVGKCKICGNDCKFYRFSKGFLEFCSCKCRSQHKHINSLVECKCIICGEKFNTIKSREKTTCSSVCLSELNRSDEVNKKRMDSYKSTMIKKYNVEHGFQLKSTINKIKNTKLTRYGASNFVNVSKCKETKLKRYGDSNYNNINKQIDTIIKKYGVNNAFKLSNYSRGTSISKFQKKVYLEVLLKYQDALLEHLLTDIKKSVDIYIPSKKLVIECHGDYWHCNPLKYKGDYYNKQVHLTANEIWSKDRIRKELLEANGYSVCVVWESEFKKGNVYL